MRDSTTVPESDTPGWLARGPTRNDPLTIAWPGRRSDLLVSVGLAAAIWLHWLRSTGGSVTSHLPSLAFDAMLAGPTNDRLGLTPEAASHGLVRGTVTGVDFAAMGSSGSEHHSSAIPEKVSGMAPARIAAAILAKTPAAFVLADEDDDVKAAATQVVWRDFSTAQPDLAPLPSTSAPAATLDSTASSRHGAHGMLIAEPRGSTGSGSATNQPLDATRTTPQAIIRVRCE